METLNSPLSVRPVLSIWGYKQKRTIKSALLIIYPLADFRLITYLYSKFFTLIFNSEVSGCISGMKKEPCVNHGLSRNCK